MLKRRLKQAGLPAHYSPHSFRGNTDHNILNSCAKRVDSVRQSRILLFYKPPQCHYGNRHLQSIVAVQTCDCRRPNWGRRHYRGWRDYRTSGVWMDSKDLLLIYLAHILTFYFEIFLRWLIR